MTPPLITESDLTIDPDGQWNFRGERLSNQSVLLYFKRNLNRDEKGFFILNRWGERREIAYLQSVRGCPLFVRSIDLVDVSGRKEESEGHFRLHLDSNEIVSADWRRIFILDDQTVVVQLPIREFPARLSPAAMTEFSQWLEVQGDDYHLRIGNQSFLLQKGDLEDLL